MTPIQKNPTEPSDLPVGTFTHGPENRAPATPEALDLYYKPDEAFDLGPYYERDEDGSWRRINPFDPVRGIVNGLCFGLAFWGIILVITSLLG